MSVENGFVKGKKITLKKEDIETILALSPMQESMLFQFLNQPHSFTNFEQLRIDLTGDISFDAFKRSWGYVTDTNELLRTLFRWKGLSTPVQVVLKECKPDIHFYDYYINNTSYNIEVLLKIDRERKFDLSDVPFRITLYKFKQKQYLMLISFHHIILDGWSIGNILKEFFHAYDCYSQDKTPSVINKSKFGQFIKWHQNQNKTVQAKYWSSYLEGLQSNNYFINGFGAIQSDGCGKYVFSLPDKLLESINNSIRRNNVTFSAFIYTAWGILLRKYKSCTDMVFGTTVSGRPPEIMGVEAMVGLFINTVPLRFKPDKNISIQELLKEINEDLIQRKEFEYTSLTDIKTYCAINTPKAFFDSIVIIENYPLDSFIINERNTLKINSYSMEERTDFDLTLEVQLHKEIAFKLSYKTSKFDEDSIVRMTGHFINIMIQMSENDKACIENIELLTEQEKRQILIEFNNTEFKFPSGQNLCKMFEEQVERTAQDVALIHNKEHITYESLNERANAFARCIRSFIKSEQVVGIFCNNSIDMVIGIIGVLKAEGAYLPIDPSLPKERIDYMLKDSNAVALLIGSDLMKIGNDLAFNGYRIFLNEDIYQSDISNLNIDIKSDGLAYVIYTSGTTGMPKGVMVNHSGIANSIQWRKSEYAFNESDVILQLFSYAFDGFLTSLFTPIVSGSTVVILDNKQIMDVVALRNCIVTHKVTHFICVPSLFQELIDYMEPDELANLRMVTLAGEKVFPGLLKICKAKAPHLELINEYGPTENSVVSTFFRNMQPSFPISVGRPISNVNVFIFNTDNNLVPVGVQGEICVSGKSLARGYLNNDELTNTKFVEMPFIPGSRIYKTGDLARWMPDGNIDYLGRIDNQVKIHGYRIEIEEIEKCLLSYSPIKNAVVDVSQGVDGGGFITAYYTTEEVIEQVKLRTYLQSRLPEYMIPSTFIKLEQLPLTLNGKIDRNALPNAKVTSRSPQDISEPESETQKVLMKIWKEVLNLERVGLHSNFFDIGGNSILLMRLHAKIDKRYPGIFTITDLFSLTSIYRLSEYVEKNQSASLEEMQFSGIEFPQEYFSRVVQKASKVYTVTLENVLVQRLKSIVEIEGLNLEVLFLSALIYVLKELSKQNSIMVYTIRNKSVKPIEIGFSLLESFRDLFQAVKSKSEITTNNFYSNGNPNFSSCQSKAENSVTILFCELLQENQRLIQSLQFDMVISYKQVSGQFGLLFEHSGRLDKNNMVRLLNTYLEILNIIIDSFEN